MMEYPPPPFPRAPQEKIRPIDKKLHYQVEKLLAAAQAAAGANGAAGAQAAPAAEGGAGAGGDDPLKYAPRPDALVPKVQLQGENRGTGGWQELGECG